MFFKVVVAENIHVLQSGGGCTALAWFLCGFCCLVLGTSTCTKPCGPTAMGKRGARRQPTPRIDMEHLVDMLKRHVKKVGVSQAFQFGKYLVMCKTQAINGGALLDKEEFLLKLMAENEALLFNWQGLETRVLASVQGFPCPEGEL